MIARPLQLNVSPVAFNLRPAALIVAFNLRQEL